MRFDGINTELLNLFRGIPNSDFRLQDFSNLPDIIFRHDVDSSLVAAGVFTDYLDRLHIQSNFFIRTNSNLYNVSSKASRIILESISKNHEIGLHIESPNAFNSIDEFEENLSRAKDLLEFAVEKKVNLISWHRPHKVDLSGSEMIYGMLNLYSSRLFSEYKYLSDSANTWSDEKSQLVKESIEGKIKLQILLHPEWWLSSTHLESFDWSILLQISTQVAEINNENSYHKNSFTLKRLMPDER